MPDLQALLDQIDRLDQQATKGPWIIDSIESGEHALFVDEDNPEYGHLGAASSTVASFLLAKNAEFIALARTALPAMSKALRAVREMHKPLNVGGIDGDHIICEVCVTINGYGGWDHRDHPCETYKAITDALGADHE